MKTRLIDLFANCYMVSADPDGGYEYALDFAKEEVESMSDLEIADTLANIDNGEEVVYDPNFCDFTTDFPEDD